MSEYDRQVKGFQLGTVLGTILYTPINFNCEIYGFRYASGYIGGDPATVEAELYSQSQGTLTGTVDVVDWIPQMTGARDSTAERPISKIEGGEYLTGVVVNPTATEASIEGVLIYRYTPGRLVGQE